MQSVANQPKHKVTCFSTSGFPINTAETQQNPDDFTTSLEPKVDNARRPVIGDFGPPSPLTPPPPPDPHSLTDNISRGGVPPPLVALEVTHTQTPPSLPVLSPSTMMMMMMMAVFTMTPMRVAMAMVMVMVMTMVMVMMLNKIFLWRRNYKGRAWWTPPSPNIGETL